MDELSRIAPPVPGLADATTLAPERSASPVPSITSGFSGPASPPPDIIVSDNPMAANTLIPATDSSTTRPTAGGIAYPFSLKVNGPDGKNVNASTLTLASVNITTPPAVDDQNEKQLGSMMPVTESVNEQILREQNSSSEQYFTSMPGAGLFSSGVQDEKIGDAEKVERPPVERFETAQEDLHTLADSSKV
jgi:hypothetical protein